MPAATIAPAVVAPAWLSRPMTCSMISLTRVGARRPHHADDEGHERVSGRAGDHRVRFPQPETRQGDEQTERDRRHPEAEQQHHAEIEPGILIRGILGDQRHAHEGGEHQQQADGKTERRPFDLLPLDPIAQAAVSHRLADEHRQQAADAGEHLARRGHLRKRHEHRQRDAEDQQPPIDFRDENPVGEYRQRDQQEVEPG
jgi:hypothetical protein